MISKTKEDRKRILNLYKQSYESDLRDWFNINKPKKRVKSKKKTIEDKYLPLHFSQMFHQKEEEEGIRQADEIKERHQKNIMINADKIKRDTQKIKIYIHKEDTLKKVNEKKIEQKREVGRFEIDTCADIISQIRERHALTINELIDNSPLIFSHYSYTPEKRKEDFAKMLERERKEREKEYETPILEDQWHKINRSYLIFIHDQTPWRIGIKQFSLKGARIKKYKDLTGEIKEVKVIGGKYKPIRSKIERKRLYGRSDEINVYKKKEIKDYRDHLQNQKYPMYWRYYKTGFEVMKAMKKEMNSWCQKHNIETKRSHPYIIKIAEDVNLKGYYEKNPDTLKRIWDELNMVKDRLLSEQSTTKI